MSIGRSLPWTRTRGELLVVRCRSLPPISIIFFSSSLSVMPAITRLSSQHGFPQNFLERGQPGGSLDQAAAAQRDHSLVKRLLFQFHRGSPNQDQLAEFVVDLHDLVQPDAPFVAAFVAGPAAPAAGCPAAPYSWCRCGAPGAARKSSSPKWPPGTAQYPCSSTG